MAGALGYGLFAQALAAPAAPDDALTGDALALIRTVITITVLPASTVLFLYLWLAFYERRAVATLGLPAAAAPKFFPGAGLGIAATLLLAFGLWLFTGASPDFRLTHSAGFTLLSALIILPVAWALQALSEEMLFRGFIVQAIGRRYGLVAAMIGSSALFAFLHAGVAPSVTQVGSVFTLGIFLCLYAVRTSSVWGPAGFHMAWNFAQVHLIGLPQPPAEGQIDPLRESLRNAPALAHLDASPEAVAIGSLIIALLLTLCLLILTARYPPATPGRLSEPAGPDDRQHPA